MKLSSTETASVRRQRVLQLYKDAVVYSNRLDFLEHVFRGHTSSRVLDVGCYGQGFSPDNPNWPHNFIHSRVMECTGIDLAPEVELLRKRGLNVLRMKAEDFELPGQFDVIHAGDVIEHLSNPGKFLDRCREHLTEDGRVIVTTPNPYFLVWLVQKLAFRPEPSTNPDHTALFSVATLIELTERHGFSVSRLDVIRSLQLPRETSLGVHLTLALNSVVAAFTSRFSETLCVTLARAEEKSSGN